VSTESLALGMFLRARRNVCQPEDHGILRDERRRVPGLKRDEVARLAGISAEYYLRLEQGRSTRPSDQVLYALARALRLDHESRQYLFRLASGDVRSPRVASEEASARAARILRPWTHAPAYVTDSNRDIIASNPFATVFGNGGLTVGANVAEYLFTDRMKSTLDDEWEGMTRGTLAGLRRDAEPFSPRLNEIVNQLSSDPVFTRLWARYEVSGTEDARVNMLMEVGPPQLDVQNYAVRSLPGPLLPVLSPLPDSIAARIFSQLAENLGRQFTDELVTADRTDRES